GMGGYSFFLCTLKIENENYSWPVNTDVDFSLTGTANADFTSGATNFYSFLFSFGYFENDGNIVVETVNGGNDFRDLETNNLSTLTYSFGPPATTTTTTTTTNPVTTSTTRTTTTVP